MSSYDTLVLENAGFDAIPQTIGGHRVCSWAKGHALAEADPLREFVQDMANGGMDGVERDDLVAYAKEVLEQADRQSENSYDE